VPDADRYLPERKESRRGIALALSGGGFRATLFHLGTLTRLNELGLLPRVDCYAGPVLDALSSIRTDLDSFSDGEIGCLENHAYALTDAAIRKHVQRAHLARPDAPFAWPSPEHAPDQPAAWEAIRHSGERGILRDVWRSAAERVGAIFDRD